MVKAGLRGWNVCVRESNGGCVGVFNCTGIIISNFIMVI